MKDFFKFMFASMLGFFLTMLILLFLLIGFIMAVVSLTKPEEVVLKQPSVLHLKLNYEIKDRTSSDPFAVFQDFSSLKPNPGLREILDILEKAKEDDHIRGIYLELFDIPSGMAVLAELRNALEDFKASGKFIYSYGSMCSQRAYYLASVSDQVYMNPEGFLELRGLRSEIVFISGLLKKLGIEPQIMRHGKFKSATEPLFLEKMSDENRLQTLEYIQSMWEGISDEITTSRNIDAVEFQLITDQLLSQSLEKAYSLNLIDSLIYMDQFLSILAGELGVENVLEEHLISLSKYDRAKITKPSGKRSRNQIAIIYAEGDIVQGEGSVNMIGGDKIARTIRNARLDEAIKAVVLRVNSPGGDGIASDVILREIALTRKEKPVVVSMGNLAASGGYYIACGADKILAQPSTITGSIGVFGLVPNFQEFFNDKLGITFDGVGTNENSDFVSITKPLPDYQRETIQTIIDRFYDTFIAHVATGRDMTVEEVDEIAQGRVWTGEDALRIGLVDQLGGLKDAIEIAADLAGLDDYRTVDLPRQKEPLQQLMESLMGDTQAKWLQRELGEHYNLFRYVKSVSEWQGIQARLPYEIRID
ncbi:MAG: signal peptide peptidase SppA [Bacteroidales bacterium]